MTTAARERTAVIPATAALPYTSEAAGAARRMVRAKLTASRQTVALHRGTQLRTLLTELNGYADLAQRKWSAWVRKQRLDDRLPPAFDQTLSAVADFADPALNGRVASLDWIPQSRQWRSKVTTLRHS